MKINLRISGNFPFYLTFFLLLVCNCSIYAYDTLRVMQIFNHIQTKTGVWNITLEAGTDGKNLFIERNNVIYLPEKIIALCFGNYSEMDGNDRLGFLLAHEIAHLLNNDIDYDRFFNPFNNKLTNENSEIKQQKEINADLRAVSILNVSGYSTKQFSNINKNIITDLYEFYGRKKNIKYGNYLSAVSRAKLINERKEVLNDYNKLYECGLILLLLSDDKNKSSILDISIEALNSCQLFSALTTPELLNNIGLGYLKKVKVSYSDEFFNESGKNNFLKFELSYIINTNIPEIRAVTPPEKVNSLEQSKKIKKIEYDNFYKKAYDYFKQADMISYDEYLPSKLNQSVLFSISHQYDEAKSILDRIWKSSYNKLKISSLLSYYFNLKGINEYCMGNKQNALQYLNMAIEENPEYLTSYKNKSLIDRNTTSHQLNLSDSSNNVINSDSLINSIIKTFEMLKSVKRKSFSFGQKEAYNFSFSTNDSNTTLIVQTKNTSERIELLKIRKGGLIGGKITTGMNIEDVLNILPDEYIITFSTNEKYYHFPKIHLLLACNNENNLEEIIIVNKIGNF